MKMLVYRFLLFTVINCVSLNASEFNDTAQSNGSDQRRLEIVENFNNLSSFNRSDDSYYFFNDTIYSSTLKYEVDDHDEGDSDNYLLVEKNNSDRPFEKIDVLSKLLRVHVDHFRDNTDVVEMVFLVDASSSVGAENFKSELNFVHKLLSDLRVEQSATRVALVTFAGKGMVKRNIDQISSNQITGNKCTLLNEQLKNVKWSGGGTYTRGALLEALTILKMSRPDAKKVVFLITDGFSNGGDPRPIAKMLKNIGAIILTFGIRTGKIDELHDIASEPGYNHSYLLDSFVEFEAMARRALHRDLKPGKYIPSLFEDSCNIFCNSSTITDAECCDKLAECNCATTSGHYTCLCPLGYFGTGLAGSCHPCPNSTYSIATSPGDSSSNCLPCPSANHITLKIPATSINDCICASGFIKNGTNCDSITCPKLRVPENGYLVKANACTNVVNAACGLRCKIGFRLVGDSIRLCSNNGAWSGTETQCILKTCPAPRPPIHGRVHCEYDDEYDYITSLKSTMNLSANALPIDARCQFKCNHGFQLLGSKIRNCLPVSRWDGLKVTCKQIKCDPLPSLPNGFINPEICTGMKKLEFGTNCSFSCMPGFELKGPTNRRCIGSSGLWSQRHIISQCIDNIPPVIKCPDNSNWNTLPGKRYSLPTWSSPIVTDNSDKNLNVWSKPHLTFPWKSKIGSHLITYIAEDSSGNRARCRFNVNIVDNEAPIIENCIDPPTFLSRNLDGAYNVTWDEPNFHDNSGKKVIVEKNAVQGSFFPIGITKVVYKVSDKSGNVATCVLNITVENICKDLQSFDHGRVNCHESVRDNVECTIMCDEGYFIPIVEHKYDDEKYLFDCNASGDDKNSSGDWNETILPSCSITEVPTSVEFGGSIFLESNSTICHEPSINIEHLKGYINEDLSMNIDENCNENGIDCRLSKIDFNCESVTTNEIQIHQRKRKSLTDEPIPRNRNRIKRKREKIEIKFWFIAKIIAENQNNSQRGVQKLHDEIEKMIKSGNLNLLDERTNREIAKLALNIRTIFNDEYKGQCNAGSVFRREKCIKCPPGTFANAVKNSCTSCYLSEYQDKSGMTSCKKCPEGTSTKKIHSSHIRDCIKLCPPGFYSKRKYHRDQLLSMEPCSTCDTGYYQPFYGERQCRPCPGNATTISRGSVNLHDCINIQDSCHQTSCLNNGLCIRESNGFSCDCPRNYIGSRCEIKRNPCEMTPCLNGGECSTANNLMDYHCSCPKKFTGLHCEQYIDECVSNPCRNNGTCITNENDFVCKCADNFAGEFCDVPQDLCTDICEEGSTCSIVDGTWYCHCKPGYLGRRCQLVPCDWLPCHPNSICINIADVNATHESYECQCPTGYTGNDCLTPIDHCHNSPCLNDGICINNSMNYTCECGLLFDGFNCEIELSSDFILHFVKPGTSDYVLMKGPGNNITELTICLWLQSMDTFNYGTVFSYATENYDNAITLTDYNGFVFYINGDNVVTDISLNDGNWHFICVTWQSFNGNWFIYVDGELKDSGKDLSINSTIAGDGSIVIGQEQDFISGGFAISEAFLGRLTLLDVWSEILNEKTIRNLSNTCENYHGNLISWPSVKKFIHGDVKILPSNFCNGCDTPTAPLHGYINISENAQEVIFSCELGYNLRVGNRIYDTIKRECMKNGEWSERNDLKCVKISCGFPGYFPRGKIHGNSYLFADEIHYTCNDGYVLRGNSHRVCNSDKYWSGRPPICIGVTCKSLLAPEHGDIEYIIEEHERDDISILQVGQQLEFKCDFGYELIGDKLLTCTKSGEWNHQIPFCQSIGCPSPPRLEHGHINYHKNGTINALLNNSTINYHKYGEIIAFSCDNGYKFEGNYTQSTFQMLKCFNNGSWIGSITNCVPIKCPWPFIERGRILNDSEMDPDGSAIGFKLLIECEKGFVSSKDDITCGSDGRWFPEGFKCVPRQCSSLTDHRIAKLFINRVNDNTTNNTGGSKLLEQLTLAIEGDKFTDKFTVQCKDETKEMKFNNGSKELIFNGISWRCDEGGVWRIIDNIYMNDDELREFFIMNDVCKHELSCAAPIVPSNDYLIEIGGSEQNFWKINESINYKCRSGYQIEGNGIIFCTENGTWSDFGKCRGVNCRNPPIISNADLVSGNNRSDFYAVGDVVEYVCSNGYRLFGQGSVRCLINGKWSRMQGKCGRISCGKPNVNEEILLEGKSYLYGEELSFKCRKSEKKGKIVCRADGSWSNLPRCNN